MSQEVIDYFNELAESAIERCHERIADLKFLTNVKTRILAGGDLSGELPQLKQVSSKDAAFVADKMIERYLSDMVVYWTISERSGIESDVTYEMKEGELIPRFMSEYRFTTEVGAVTLTLSNQGNHVDLDIDTADVKNMDFEAAIHELSNQLLFARLKQPS